MNIIEQIEFELSQVKIDWKVLHLISRAERFDASWIFIQQKERNFLDVLKVSDWNDIDKGRIHLDHADELICWLDGKMEVPQLITCTLVAKSVFLIRTLIMSVSGDV